MSVAPSASRTDDAIGRAARVLGESRRVVAFTGAGMSVESGIPDFRSEGGIWTRFDPYLDGSLDCFLRDPERAWRFYRALGQAILGKSPHGGHRALARLEAAGHLWGVVTQNVDGLHRAAGVRRVVEIHGEGQHLQCLRCETLTPLRVEHLEPGPVPRCRACGQPLKPNVVLFGEEVRQIEEAQEMIRACDLLLVIGTSGDVSPANLFPLEVLARGGSLVELNVRPAFGEARGLGPRGVFVQGEVGQTLPRLAEKVR